MEDRRLRRDAPRSLLARINRESAEASHFGLKGPVVSGEAGDGEREVESGP